MMIIGVTACQYTVGRTGLCERVRWGEVKYTRRAEETLKANTHLLGSPEDTKSHLPTLTGSWPALSSAPLNTSLYSLGNNLAASAAATSPGPVDTLTRSGTSPVRWSSSLTRSWTYPSIMEGEPFTWLVESKVYGCWLSEWYISHPLWADLELLKKELHIAIPS